MTLSAFMKIAILIIWICKTSCEEQRNERAGLSDNIPGSLLKTSRGQIRNLQGKQASSNTIALRRQDGRQTFNRKWVDYKVGFGDPHGDLWIGLEKLHELTSKGRYKLRVDLTDWSGQKKWALYSTFSVASETEMYKISVSGYDSSSTAGDSLTQHNGAKFSTPDKDNDQWSGNCARTWEAGWWYTNCFFAHLTGFYGTGPNNGGIKWFSAYNDYRGFKATTLTLIPVTDVVFLHRQDSSVDFNKGWTDYRNGFGDPRGNFWLGLEKLHQLTGKGGYKLRVDLTAWNGDKKYAEYSHFSVAGEDTKYKLSVSGYNTASTTASDSMKYANGMKFTTKDNDNDNYGLNMAIGLTGGWWYDMHPAVHITGLYKPDGYGAIDAMFWYGAYDNPGSLKAATLTVQSA